MLGKRVPSRVRRSASLQGGKRSGLLQSVMDLATFNALDGRRFETVVDGLTLWRVPSCPSTPGQELHDDVLEVARRRKEGRAEVAWVRRECHLCLQRWIVVPVARGRQSLPSMKS